MLHLWTVLKYEYYEETLPRSSPSSILYFTPRQTCLGRESNPGYSNSLCCCYSEPLHRCPSVWHSYTPQGVKAPVWDHQDKHATTFTRIALISDSPWVCGTCKCACLNHVGVTTMKKLDQGYLHSLQDHPETNMQTLAKSYLNSLCCCYSEPLHRCPSVWHSHTPQG